MSVKRARTPSQLSEIFFESSPSTGSASPTPKAARTSLPSSSRQLLCTLPPTCNPPKNRPTPLAGSAALEAHYATYHAHVCEEHGCGCVFPDARLLELHQTECHDPLAAVRKERGEKIFACHLASCQRRFLTPKARRLHLIEAHGYPKQYFFAVTNKGVGGLLRRWGEGASLLRGQWRAREGDEDEDDRDADDDDVIDVDMNMDDEDEDEVVLEITPYRGKMRHSIRPLHPQKKKKTKAKTQTRCPPWHAPSPRSRSSRLMSSSGEAPSAAGSDTPVPQCQDAGARRSTPVRLSFIMLLGDVGVVLERTRLRSSLMAPAQALGGGAALGACQTRRWGEGEEEVREAAREGGVKVGGWPPDVADGGEPWNVKLLV